MILSKPFFSLLVMGVFFSGASISRAQFQVETLAQYQFPNLLEGIALDREGNVYMSMPLTGEIRKRTPDGTESPLAVIPASPLGLDVDDAGNVFAALDSNAFSIDPPNSMTHGVWQIQANGTAARLAPLPFTSLPNDVAIGEGGSLFVSDSITGSVHTVASDGTVAEWIVDPLLLGVNLPPLPSPTGANGIAYTGTDLFVANTTAGSIIRVPVLPDGSAGVATVAFADPLLVGADGLAADDHGNLFVANILQNTVLRLTPDGMIDTLADATDGLDGPSSLELGPNQEVYFVNSGLTTAGQPGGNPMPSLMRVIVPEPSSSALAGLCLIGYFASRRRR